MAQDYYTTVTRFTQCNIINFATVLVLDRDADTGKYIDEVVKLIQILSNQEYDSKIHGITLVIHHQVAEPKWENV